MEHKVIQDCVNNMVKRNNNLNFIPTKYIKSYSKIMVIVKHYIIDRFRIFTLLTMEIKALTWLVLTKSGHTT